jgi:O-antigen/teichoic acid export membrane protein
MGVRKNFIYSSILTCASYIFPLLTFPYVSRVLGVNNIGICNFVDSIIRYYVLFSVLGINILGNREIAACMGNRYKLDKCFSSLFALNIISTLIVLVIFVFCTLYIPALSPYKDMMFIGGFKIVFTLFLIEWFFKGVEDFKYITIRSILIKAIYVVCVFVFVKKADDYPIYYALSVAMAVANCFFNWFYRRKFATFILKLIDFKPYIKPFFILGTSTLLSSMYTSFNVTYLGFVSGATEVGYYTTATKLFTVVLALFSAFTGVMTPRISSLFAENDINKIKQLTANSFELLIIITMPLVVYMIVFAPQIIILISGLGYEGAITPMRIVMPLLLLIGIEQILVLQLLIPFKQDKAIFINFLIGACIGLFCNIVFVSQMGSVGSAIAWVISEIMVFGSAYYYVKKIIGNIFPFKSIVMNLLFLLPLVAIFYFVYMLDFSSILTLGLSIIILVIYVFILQIYILKNSFFCNQLLLVVNKIKK